MIVTLSRTKESAFHSPKTVSLAHNSFCIYMQIGGRDDSHYHVFSTDRSHQPRQP